MGGFFLGFFGFLEKQNPYPGFPFLSEWNHTLTFFLGGREREGRGEDGPYLSYDREKGSIRAGVWGRGR